VSHVTIAPACTRWTDQYDTERNLTRDLDASVTAGMLARAKARVR
jgi:hypothetical protein